MGEAAPAQLLAQAERQQLEAERRQDADAGRLATLPDGGSNGWILRDGSPSSNKRRHAE
jgi:hypothetical protein